MVNALLIAGTDTEVGKTVVTTALAAYWQTYYPRYPLGIMKPIQAGEGDRELYSQLFQLDQTSAELNPLFFSAPLAPPLAAAQENKTVELAVAWRALQQLMECRHWVLVESAGGLGSPVTWELTNADLAAAWRLPLLLVAPVKLGVISQVVAHVALARQYNLSIQGILLNCTSPLTDAEIDQWAPANLITNLTQVPVLGCLPYQTDPCNLSALTRAASHWILERIVPAPISTPQL